MKCLKFLIVPLLTIFCCMHAAAQDSEYVYKDSSIIKADSIATRSMVVDMKKNKAADEDNDTDTTVQNNQLAVAADSAEALKNLPPLPMPKI